MPRKRGNVSNDEFMGRLLVSSKKTTDEVSQTLSRTADTENKDRIEHIDIRLMEDAPAEWNLYPLMKNVQPDKYLELKMSIYQIGVQDPIKLWERPGEKYMILAGHNRRSICAEILEECKSEKDFDENKFRFPPCIVFKEDELTEESAKEIINDTNLYRDFSKLPNKVKIAVTRYRSEVYAKRRYAKGARINQLMKELGLEKSAVYENLSIAEKVIEPLQEMYYTEKLTRKSVIKFVMFDSDTQEWIYTEFGDKLTDARIRLLKKNMNRDDIALIFDPKEKGTKLVKVEIPCEAEKDFLDMVNKWLAEREGKSQK